jgi:type VI protein secretion system component VasK
MNMNATDFIQAVDHAAGMNDRWLFLAAFCLLLLLCGLVIYWLVRQLQAVIADHKELRNEHHAALAEIIAAQNETAMKLAVCIDRNSEALRECAFELRRFQEGGASRTGH